MGETMAYERPDPDLGIGRAKSICLFNLIYRRLIGLDQEYKVYKAIKLGV